MQLCVFVKVHSTHEKSFFDNVYHYLIVLRNVLRRTCYDNNNYKGVMSMSLTAIVGHSATQLTLILMTFEVICHLLHLACGDKEFGLRNCVHNPTVPQTRTL